MPPSPRLSARISRKTYLNVTMRISAQMKSEATPMTLSRRSVRTSAGDVVQRFAHRVERARADVAEDDAERRESQFQDVLAALRRLRDRRDYLLSAVPCTRPMSGARRSTAELTVSDLAAPSRSGRHDNGAAFGRQGLQSHGRARAWAGFLGGGALAPRLVAQPVGQFLAASGAVRRLRRRLVLAAGLSHPDN